MGAKFATLYANGDRPFDIDFDTVIGIIIETFYTLTVEVNGKAYNVLCNATKGQGISMRELLDKLRENPGNFEITNIFIAEGQEMETVIEGDNEWAASESIVNTISTNRVLYRKPVDLARLWAYQLANAEYYTNSHVDSVFSAELYRQYVYHIVTKITGAETFEWNGINYEYDYLSAFYFGEIVSLFIEEIDEDEAEYYASIFAYRRSLKYLDYFTGSKTKPLATGDVTINPELGGGINVIDVSRKGQAYRFYNAVNRIGRKAEDYTLEIMGVKQRHDFHNPLWLGSTRTNVTANVTDNTGAAQIEEANAQTSRLYGIDGKYKFEFNLDRDAIIVGITFYDVERSYIKGVHRSFMHVDRFDMFNPYMQYTGDQPIYGEEFSAGNTQTFGYTPAYEEFKQEFNTADAGFVTALPGYTFMEGVMTNNREESNPDATNIGSEFIRSKPVEFDRFYNSLTGYSLGTYFHFILDYYNDLNAKRKMAFNPSVGL